MQKIFPWAKRTLKIKVHKLSNLWENGWPGVAQVPSVVFCSQDFFLRLVVRLIIGFYVKVMASRILLWLWFIRAVLAFICSNISQDPDLLTLLDIPQLRELGAFRYKAKAWLLWCWVGAAEACKCVRPAFVSCVFNLFKIVSLQNVSFTCCMPEGLLLTYRTHLVSLHRYLPSHRRSGKMYCKCFFAHERVIVCLYWFHTISTPHAPQLACSGMLYAR